MASYKSSSNFKRANHSEKVLSILKVYFQRQEMCDIVIIAGIDGVKVPAHHILLSACSLYFLNLFTNAMHRHSDNELTVASVSGSSLRALIDYCYSGEIEIRKDNVKILLDAAYRLEMADVYKACQDYYVDHLDASNSLQVAQIAESYSFKDVQRKAEAFTYKHYMEVCKTQQFLHLNIEQLCKLIASDDLVVNSEEDVFNSCVSWVDDGRVDREKLFYQLLALVRLPLLSPRFITEQLRSHSLCKSSECKELIFEAMAWHLNPIEQSLLNTQPRITTDRLSADEILVASTGNLSTDTSCSVSRHVHTADPIIHKLEVDEILVAISRDSSIRNAKIACQSYNNTTNEWTDCKIELPNQGRSVYTMIGDSLLIVGEYEDSSNPGNVYSYNFKSKTLTEQKPLNSPRAEMGCAVLDGYVYVVGGFDSSNNILNTVERWDPKVQSWTYMSAMAVKRQGLGVAVLGKYLYAVGGYSGSCSSEKSMERYDPYTNQWTSMASMNVGRLCPGVTAGQGYLYAVGDSNYQGLTTSTVQRFNPVANKWTMISSARNARKPFSCIFLGDRLITLGFDYILSDCHTNVEEYDLKTNKWTLMKRLSVDAHLTRLVKIPKIYLSP